MKYADGQDIQLGDHVQLLEDNEGTVVGLIAAGAYRDGYTAAEWAYLKTGVMIEFPTYGLIHYEEPEEDLLLLGRAE